MNLKSVTCEIRSLLWLINPKWGIPTWHIWRRLIKETPAFLYCAHCHKCWFDR